MLISIIIPTYNRWEYLVRAVNSVLNQTYQNLEVIIIDDASTEKNYENLELFFKDPRVKIIRCQINMKKLHNVSAAQGMTRNAGIQIAKGDFIGFLDDDDFFFPNKLEIEIDILQKFPQFKIICSNMLTGNGINPETYKNPFYKENFGYKISDNLYIINKYDLDRTNYISNSTALVAKEIVDKVGLQVLGINEDYEYWKRCLQHTDALYTDTFLVGYDMSHGYGQNYN